MEFDTVTGLCPVASSEATHYMYYVREINPALGVEVHQLMKAMPQYRAKYHKNPRTIGYRLKKIMAQFEIAFKQWRKDGDGDLFTIQQLLKRRIIYLLKNCYDEAREITLEINAEQTTLEVKLKEELLITFS